MKIIICDEYNHLGEQAKQEMEYLQEQRPGWEVEIYPYDKQPEAFHKKMETADGVISAFIPFHKKILEKMQHVRCISINATGYGNVDLEAASELGIGVMAVEEYCTQEVAEHTMSMMLSLLRRLKEYDRMISEEKKWQYQLENIPLRIQGQKLGIFGYGKIGKRVVQLAKAFDMTIYVYQSKEHPVKEEPGIILADAKTIYENCTIISNHMRQSQDNHYFFNEAAFSKMKKKPIFINMGRGDTVSEEALAQALDNGIVSGAALDVLESENPDLLSHPLVNRKNVIITPHAAFYSKESAEALCRKACDNLIYYLERSYSKIHHLVNPEVKNREGSV